MVKSWLSSKTVWVGILEIFIGALGLLATFLQAGDYTPASIAFLSAGILTIILRFMTTEAVM